MNAIIIPAYNEEKHIGTVVRKAKQHGTVIVVNDGSKDNTSSVAKKAGAIVLEHCVNLGKGNALKTGCDYAYRERFKNIVVMDADGQHLPKDIPRFLEALKKVDIVYGSREHSGTDPLAMRLGNKFFTLFTRVLFGVRVEDTQSGFRAWKRATYKKIRWSSTGYAVESEIIYRARHLKYKEITIPRIYLDEVKGTTPLDGIPIALAMIRWKLFGG